MRKEILLLLLLFFVLFYFILFYFILFFLASRHESEKKYQFRGLPSQKLHPSPPCSFKIISLLTYNPFYFIIIFYYRGSCFMYGIVAEWGFRAANKRVRPALPDRECLKNNLFSALVSYPREE